MAAFFPSTTQSPLERLGGLAVAVLLHGAALWGLLQVDAVRQAVVQVAPIMVSLIEPPRVEEPPRPAPPPPPRPAPKVVAPPPLLATRAAESPSPIVVPPPPPQPQPAPAAVEAPPVPVPATIVPPGFAAAYLHNPPPAYPPLSRRLGEEGKVLLRVAVSAEGAAEAVDVQAGSGFPRLDRAAVEAVRAWRFVPARQAGRAVPGIVIVPIRFALES